MPFIHTNNLNVFESVPGWRGRFFHSTSMTFVQYEFDQGASIHDHSHAEEEVWNVIEGELELTIDGITQIVGPGMAGVIPGNVHHSARALTSGRALIVDYPLRRDFA